MRVDIDVGVVEAIARLRAVASDVPNKAIVRALNRVANTVRAGAARDIRSELGAPYRLKDVRDALRVRNAQPVTLTALVRASGQRTLSAVTFSPLRNSRGVSFRYRGRRVTLPHAFIGKGSRKAIYIRSDEWRAQLYPDTQFRRQRVYRSGLDYPIAQIRVQGIPLIFVEQKIADRMRNVANTRFPVELERAVRSLRNGR